MNPQTRGKSIGEPVWLKVGDKVSVAKWDKFDRPANQIGSPAVVQRVDCGVICETGVMVTVVGTSGRNLRVDLNWLLPI